MAIAFDGRARMLDRRNMVKKSASGSVASALRSSHVSNNMRDIQLSYEVTPSNHGNLKENMNFDSNKHIEITG